MFIFDQQLVKQRDRETDESFKVCAALYLSNRDMFIFDQQLVKQREKETD